MSGFVSGFVSFENLDLEGRADVLAFRQQGRCCRPREHARTVREHFGRRFPPAKDGVCRKGRTVEGGRGLLRGRGHGVVDLVLRHVDGGKPAEVPVLLKGNKSKRVGRVDNRDLSQYHAECIAHAQEGGALWVYHLWLAGDTLVMRRCDAARVIRECRGSAIPNAPDAEKAKGIGPTLTWGVRYDPRSYKLKSGAVRTQDYWRLRIEWNRVPESMWLDSEPIPFDSTAPLPSGVRFGRTVSALGEILD